MALQLPDYRLINDVNITPVDVAGSIQSGAFARKALLDNKTTWGKIADREKARQIISNNTTETGIDYDKAVRELTSAGLREDADLLLTQKVAVTNDRRSNERVASLEKFRQAVLAGVPIEEAAAAAGVSPETAAAAVKQAAAAVKQAAAPAVKQAAAPAEPSAPVAPVATSTYIIKPGDALWKIAKKFNTTWQELAKVNNLDPSKVILPNQKLIIPGNESAPVAEKIEVKPSYKSVEEDYNLPNKFGLNRNNKSDFSNVYPKSTDELVNDRYNAILEKNGLVNKPVAEIPEKFNLPFTYRGDEPQVDTEEPQKFSPGTIGPRGLEQLAYINAKFGDIESPQAQAQKQVAPTGNQTFANVADVAAPVADTQPISKSDLTPASTVVPTTTTTSTGKTRPMTAQEIARLYLETVPLSSETSLDDILRIMNPTTSTGKLSIYEQKKADLDAGFNAAFGDAEGQDVWNRYESLLAGGNVTRDQMRNMQYELNSKVAASDATAGQKKLVYEMIKTAAAVQQPSLAEIMTQLETGTATTTVIKSESQNINRMEEDLNKLEKDYDAANYAQSVMSSNLQEGKITPANLNAALTVYSRQLSNEALSDQEFIRKMSSLLPGWIGLIQGVGMKITGDVPADALKQMVKIKDDLKKGIDEYYQAKISKERDEINNRKSQFNQEFRGKDYPTAQPPQSYRDKAKELIVELDRKKKEAKARGKK